MIPSLLVALGGLVGSVARFWLGGLVQRASGSAFPIGTLGVNVLGSFVVGVVMAVSVERSIGSPNARLFLATGFCGGFTTMSTFSYETVALVRSGEATLAAGNVVVTLALCIAAVVLGGLAGRSL